jgi:hypothetical protein
MSKGARVRAGRTRAHVMAHRASVRMAYQEEQNPDLTTYGAMERVMRKFTENRHARRKEAVRARRQARHG